MAIPGIRRLQRWRVVTVAGQAVIAANFIGAATKSPATALMVIPAILTVLWSLYGLVRRGPGRLDSEQLLAEFGPVRGLGLGTMWWVGLSAAGVLLQGLTGAYGWGLLAVVGFVAFVSILSAHLRALKLSMSTTDRGSDRPPTTYRH